MDESSEQRQDVASGFYEKQKEVGGGFATYAWIGFGLWHFLRDGGLASLFSIKALIFFGVGMFVAAFVFGGLFYLLQRGLTKGLMLFIRAPSSGAATFVGVLGIALTIIELVLIFWVGKWTYEAWG